jgi:hypothetical protein
MDSLVLSGEIEETIIIALDNVGFKRPNEYLNTSFLFIIGGNAD